jgi:hypothetical protein
MAENLLYLGMVFDEKAWLEKANQNVQNIQQVLEQYPTSFGYWASVFLKQTLGLHEIAITGADPETALREVLQIYLPNKILQSSNRLVDFPLLKDKDYKLPHSIYHCRQYACTLPVTSTEDFKKQLFKEYLNINVHNN